MSYYLCIGVAQAYVPDLEREFGESVKLTDVSNAPIGKLVRKRRPFWSAYVAQSGFDSSALVGRVARRNADRSQVVVRALRNLMTLPGCYSTIFILHWTHGYIATERIDPTRRERIALSDLEGIVSNIEDEVLYTLVK